MDSIRTMIKHDGRRSFHLREDFKKNLEEETDTSPEASPEAPSPKEPLPLKATIRYFPDSGHTKIYYQTSSGKIKHIRIADDSWSVKEMDSSAPHHYKVSYRVGQNGQRRHALLADKFELVGFEDDD